MAMLFNKLAVRGGIAIGLGMAAGGILLALGLTGGHKWQVIAGGSLLGTGTIGTVVLVTNLYLPRDKDLALQQLTKMTLKNPNGNYWTLIGGGRKPQALIASGSETPIVRYVEEMDAKEKSYTRIVFSLFARLEKDEDPKPVQATGAGT